MQPQQSSTPADSWGMTGKSVATSIAAQSLQTSNENVANQFLRLAFEAIPSTWSCKAVQGLPKPFHSRRQLPPFFVGDVLGVLWVRQKSLHRRIRLFCIGNGTVSM